MATILPKGKLKGISGPIYYRSLNGKEIFQMRPNRSKQRKENNTNAIMFKQTVESLKVLRCNIEAFLGKRHDSKVHQRLTGQVMTLLRKQTKLPIKQTTIFNTSLIDLIGFDWNINSLFFNTFEGEITTEILSDTNIRVSVLPFVPVQDVIFPSECTHATMRLESYQLTDKNIIHNCKQSHKSFDFQKGDTSSITFTFDIEPLIVGVFTIVVVEIQFFYPINNNPNQLTLYNSKACNPSKVVYVSNMQIEEK